MIYLEAPAGASLHDDNLTGLMQRVRSEFLEMPGLCLTSAQAARLWAVDSKTSTWLLDGLATAGFLSRNRDGAYQRVSVA